MDVLANYTTYQTFWRIEKATEEDPEYDAKKARRAIARFVSLHPHHLAQKAEIIVEHFRQHTAKEMGGLAKAMVVTSSRLHAVRYKQAIDKYINAKGYADIKTLVAFSGKIDDGTGRPLTETNMNGFPESQTAEEFATPDYGVLIVAEKFQTGFDQPLLHTMYVDKPLVGLAAVQTLSRLNRIHPLKESTFVLDFRNDTEDIVEAFEQFHGCTVAPPTDPTSSGTPGGASMTSTCCAPRRSRRRCPRCSAPAPPRRSARRRPTPPSAPAKARFEALDDERAPGVPRRAHPLRADLLVRLPDRRLHRPLARARLRVLPSALALPPRHRHRRAARPGHRGRAHPPAPPDDLQRRALADRGESARCGRSSARAGAGQQELDLEHLSSIVEVLNDRFGTDLTDVDKLLLRPVRGELGRRRRAVDQAQQQHASRTSAWCSTRSSCRPIITRVDANDEIFKRILDDEEFRRHSRQVLPAEGLRAVARGPLRHQRSSDESRG